MSWSKRLVRPVPTPEGKPIVTLDDAPARYVLALPKDRQNDPHVLAGVAAIMLAANGEVCELVAQSAVAHIVHGPLVPTPLGKRERPWMKSKRTVVK